MTAAQMSAAIRAGKTTAVEAAEAVLAQIEAVDKKYNCYVTVDREGALAQAKAVQGRIETGELTGPLAGVPVAVKDNICTEGLRTTCSSRILYNFVPPYTAEAVKNLLGAGAVILGKTNMDEFAMGSTTETSAYGPTKNPRNPAHVPVHGPHLLPGAPGHLPSAADQVKQPAEEGEDQDQGDPGDLVPRIVLPVDDDQHLNDRKQNTEEIKIDKIFRKTDQGHRQQGDLQNEQQRHHRCAVEQVKHKLFPEHGLLFRHDFS